MTRILVIDDEEQVRDVLRRMLERLGYEVDQARDGAEGVTKFNENDIDLVISDVFMPGKDGLDTLIELRKIDPNARILLISGNWARLCVDAGHLAEHLGAIGVLEKPFRMNDVRDRVSAALVS